MATLLKIKRLGWAVVFVLVTVVGLLSHISGRRYVAAMGAVEHTLAVESAINGLVSLLKDAETAQRGYLLSGEPQFLEPYEVARRELPAAIQQLTDLARGNSAQEERLTRLKALADEKMAFVRGAVDLRVNGDANAARQRVRTSQGKVIMDRIRALTRMMLDHEEKLLEQRKAEARAAEVTAIWGVGIGSVLTVLRQNGTEAVVRVTDISGGKVPWESLQEPKYASVKLLLRTGGGAREINALLHRSIYRCQRGEPNCS
jgi:CHASE3 domain sensor protein